MFTSFASKFRATPQKFEVICERSDGFPRSLRDLQKFEFVSTSVLLSKTFFYIEVALDILENVSQFTKIFLEHL